MHRELLIGFFILTQFVAKAQTSCNCPENFEFVYAKIKTNYAGWQDKTRDQKEFLKFTSQQREKAEIETRSEYCYKIIHDWLSYFRDHHTHLYNETPSMSFAGKTDQEIREHFSQTERIELDENELMKSISITDEVEGIWQMVNGPYRVAIIRNKTIHRDFAGVVLNADSVYWLPGQVKMELTEGIQGKFSTMFYMRDHSLRMTSTTLANNELQFEGLSTFRKVFPVPTEVKTERSVEQISSTIELKKLNATTVYFRIPTFNHQVKNRVDSLIQANHDLITDVSNLIIDVRNNGGGSDVTYSELIQYLYTNKIVLVNNSIWSSADNIQKFNSILEDPEYPESSKEYIRKLVKRLEDNPGEFVRKENNTIKQKGSLKYPSHVIILINRYCASSCEEFVLAAKQSKNVTLMGENTMGVLDYANIHTLALPCQGWELQYATSRTNRLPDFPIDNIGIEPNIKITEEKNWVEFALEYLRIQ